MTRTKQQETQQTSKGEEMGRDLNNLGDNLDTGANNLGYENRGS